MSQFAYNILGKTSVVYPGHPITLAYLIVRRYDNWQAAVYKRSKDSYGAALESCDIPGAGGNVCNALNFLRMIKDGMAYEVACVKAELMWYNCDNHGTRSPKTLESGHVVDYQERWANGVIQAAKYKDALKVLLTGWF